MLDCNIGNRARFTTPQEQKSALVGALQAELAMLGAHFIEAHHRAGVGQVKFRVTVQFIEAPAALTNLFVSAAADRQQQIERAIAKLPRQLVSRASVSQEGL